MHLDRRVGIIIQILQIIFTKEDKVTGFELFSCPITDVLSIPLSQGIPVNSGHSAPLPHFRHYSMKARLNIIKQAAGCCPLRPFRGHLRPCLSCLSLTCSHSFVLTFFSIWQSS
jgi:hypothetical protein